ncbi:hypothetical protein B0H13DRAFT_1853480 [Mycena leptocephala]|nr:hypothetical protein B0H13DRAFT_1853480 [Mycena leptocephala]
MVDVLQASGTSNLPCPRPGIPSFKIIVGNATRRVRRVRVWSKMRIMCSLAREEREKRVRLRNHGSSSVRPAKKLPDRNKLPPFPLTSARVLTELESSAVLPKGTPIDRTRRAAWTVDAAYS